MDENWLKKFRNLVSTCPRPSDSWTDLTDSASSAVDATRQLVVDFLTLVAGDQIPALLADVLSERQKESLPWLSDLGDRQGSKRLAKLNAVLHKSPPLKPWSLRAAGKRDNAIRLEVELTARRSLSYLSGGEALALLEDILYPNEKEVFCARYRAAMVRIGEATRQMHPKSKVALLGALRQSGFSKEELRGDLQWGFSNHLWTAGHPAAAAAAASPIAHSSSSPRLASDTPPVLLMLPSATTPSVMEEEEEETVTTSRTVRTRTTRRQHQQQQQQQHRARRKKRRKPRSLPPAGRSHAYGEDDPAGAGGSGERNAIYLNNFVSGSAIDLARVGIGGNRSPSSLRTAHPQRRGRGARRRRTTSSDEDDDDEQRTNPMFPQLY